MLGYLASERVAAPDTNTAWIIDGYPLSTHPDLCDRVREVDEAAGEPAEFRYLYGKPVLIAENGVIIAFGGGTYVFCLRLPRSEVDPRLVGERKEKLSEHPLLRQKQEQLEALVANDWTRVDPWTVDVPKDEGAEASRRSAHARGQGYVPVTASGLRGRWDGYSIPGGGDR